MKVTTLVIGSLAASNTRTHCATTHCPTCNTEHRAYCHIDVDPHGTAQRIATHNARSWQRTHPCKGRRI